MNGLDASFWATMPLPLAEIGGRLDAGGQNYADSLLKLAEDAITLAGALGLARVPVDASDVWAKASRLMTTPAFGSRIELLWLIEGIAPGATGWDPEEDAAELVELIALVNPGSVPRHPRTRHVFQAITKLRNDMHHRRLLSERHGAAEGMLESAVFAMVRRNLVFYSHYLFVDQVQKTQSGGHELKAWSLRGPTPARYRRGHWQPARDDVSPGRIVCGDSGRPVDMHPFMVFRGDRTYVLDELKSGAPVLRHFATRQVLDKPPQFEGRRFAGHEPVLGMPVPASQAKKAAVSRERTAAKALAGCGLAGALSVALVGVVGAWLWTTDRDPAELSGTGSASIRAGVCPVTARRNMPPEQDLARLLTGAPVHWGSSLADLEAECGSLAVVGVAECASGILDSRETAWEPTLSIPDRLSTRLNFHRSRGLFEVVVYSHARPFAVAAAVEQHLGPPHTIGRVRHTWLFPVGAEHPTNIVKVTGLFADDPRGRSVVRVHYPSTYEAYTADIEAAGCR